MSDFVENPEPITITIDDDDDYVSMTKTQFKNRILEREYDVDFLHYHDEGMTSRDKVIENLNEGNYSRIKGFVTMCSWGLTFVVEEYYNN